MLGLALRRCQNAANGARARNSLAGSMAGTAAAGTQLQMAGGVAGLDDIPGITPRGSRPSPNGGLLSQVNSVASRSSVGSGGLYPGMGSGGGAGGPGSGGLQLASQVSAARTNSGDSSGFEGGMGSGMFGLQSPQDQVGWVGALRGGQVGRGRARGRPGGAGAWGEVRLG